MISVLPRDLAAALVKAPIHVRLHGVVGPARPFFAAQIYRCVDTPLLVITAGNRDAERYRDEAAFYLPPGIRVHLFPEREVLPFEPLSPEPAISATRIATLSSLTAGGRPFVVTTLEAALQFLIPKGKIALSRLEIARGGALSWDRFRRHLLQWGYRPAPRVAEPGEFSIRGGIVDLFPPALDTPVRIEFSADEVDSLHRFDPGTQRNIDRVERVTVMPAREIFLDTGVLGALKKHLPAGDGSREADDSGIFHRAVSLPGLEHYGAALLRSQKTLLDYYPAPPLLLLDEWPDLEGRAKKLDEDLRQGATRAALPNLAQPEQAFQDFDAWRARIRDLSVIHFDLFDLSPETDRQVGVETATGRGFLSSGGLGPPREGPLPTVVRALAAWQARTGILVLARTPDDADRLAGICRELGLGTVPLAPEEVPRFVDNPQPGAPRITWGAPAEGFAWAAGNLAIISEDDIFGTRFRARAGDPPPRGNIIPDFALLRPGDHLVHKDYGIGRFGCLMRLPTGDGEQEFLLITYQEEARLYVPVGSLDRVQRYIAAEGARPHLDRLGGRGWATTKKRAKKALLTMARDLLRLAAIRQTAPGHAFPPDTPWQAEFEMAFEYPPTMDQLRAAEETKADMEKPHPMDRLVCGDVGYGKTEIAMRAAFKAVMDGKQVAVLAPTTVLTQQHSATFRERFASWPTRIATLSRFVAAKEQKRIVAEIAAGAVDIVIGTHRLLGRDIVFHDLGLLVVDEEQRFGVKHKESLKRLRSTVDVLTLTATPIPRTLHLALAGLRELSLIATPPENRLAIQTRISRFSPVLIAEAIRRELARGGQVFFIHNRVQSISRIGSWLQRLLPEARIGIAHGQMEERRLAETMALFRSGDYDVLLSTSIVESGLDIANANTMIVNRADHFGLAELYQLRGRIGRSHHRAYAYLLIPGEEALSPEARRRIEVLREYSHLGAGFQIALYDLEIRGAGNVVGYQQSGHIAALGFELYAEMLQNTIRELQGEAVPDEDPTQVALPFTIFLPEGYVPETAQRLIFYKRIAAARDGAGLEEAALELRELYGPLPGPAQRLLWAAELRLAGQALGLERMDWRSDILELTFRPGRAPVSERSTAPLAGATGRARATEKRRVAWRWGSEKDESRLAEAREFLQGLQASG